MFLGEKHQEVSEGGLDKDLILKITCKTQK